MGVPFLIGVLISTAVSMAVSMIGRPSGRDRRSKGYGFDFSGNAEDPNAPIPIVYGAPDWVPPVLARWANPENVNSLEADGSVPVTLLLSLGIGELDGRALDVWLNDLRALETVDGTLETTVGTLTNADSLRRKWYFPHDDVVRETVVLRVDDVLFARWANGGLFTDTDVVTDVEAQSIRTELFGPAGTAATRTDPSLSGMVVGAMLPEGAPHGDSLRIRANLTTGASYLSTSQRSFGRLASGEWYVFFPKISVVNWQVQFVARTVWLSYTTTTTKTREVEFGREDGGRSYVVFPATQDNVTITATYKSLSYDPAKIAFAFRPGESGQDPLPLDAVRDTVAVGGELTESTDRTYSGATAVDDLVIAIEAPSGFYDQAIAGNNAGAFFEARRRIQIQIKESAATDRIATLDPALGWVTLRPQDSDATEFVLRGTIDGSASWHFSCADLLNWMLTGQDCIQTSFIQRTAFDIKVTALDAPQTRYLDYPPSTGIATVQSAIWFASVTEVRRTRVTLPRHATLQVDIADPSILPAEPVVAVRFAGRKVWVPEAGAALDTATGLPEPGKWKWSRNPVWCTCDLITSGTFGSGDYYTWSHIDLAAALTAAAFCDATVDGETRAEIDYVVSDRSALLDHVARMLAGAGIIPTLSGGTWRFLPDVDGSTVMDITDADIQDGEIAAVQVSLEESVNRIEYAFTDEDAGGELVTDSLTLPDAEPSAIVQRRIDLRGVRRRSQARRVASLLLHQWANVGISVDLAMASYRALALEAGDLVTLTSTTLGYTEKKFRVGVVSWGSNLQVGLRLVEHSPEAYTGRNVRHVPVVTKTLPSAYAIDAPLLASRLSATRVSPPARGRGGAYYRLDWGRLPKRGRRVRVEYRLHGAVSWKTAEEVAP